MNAVLQSLLACPDFVSFLLACQVVEHCESTLVKMIAIAKNFYPESEDKDLDASVDAEALFKPYLTKLSSKYCDANDFLAQLLKEMHEETW